MFARVCEGAGLVTEAYADFRAATDAIRANAVDVLVLVEEAAHDTELARLQQVLDEQPTWSDLPIVVLAQGSEEGTPSRRRYEALGNVTLLGRPVRVFSLVSTLRACLRARARQREVAALLARHESDLAEIELGKRRLDFVLETARIGTLSLDGETEEVSLCERGARFYGLGAGPLRAPLAEFVHRLHPDDAERTQVAFRRVLRDGGAVDLDHRVDGHWMRVLGGFTRAGDAPRIEGVVLDETERHLAAAALAESEARYRAVGESTPYGVWVSDADGHTLYLSESFLRLLGTNLGEVRRRGWTHLLAPEEARRVEEAFATARASGLPVDVEFRCGDRVVLTRGSPLPTAEGEPTWVGVHLDVTDRRRMEDELARIDRLSSVSVLAGGIAHDFNNILGAVLANANLAKRQIEREDPRAKERVEKIETAVRHAKYIVGQLLSFARGTAPLRSSLRLSDVLRDASAFAVQGSACALEVDIAPDLWSVSADGGQIGQVVHNLTLNAVQAQEGGGKVRLHAANVELAAADVPPVPAGRYVRVRVEDEGPGIPADLVQRVFDPFMTTKPGGHGLGLATAFTVVRRHGGHLTLTNEEGRGCTFCFFLPATMEEEAAEAPPTGEVQGDERVLLMDDDAQIRDVVYTGLSELGYQVVCAEHGEAALDHWRSAREAGDPFDVVVLDLTVPGGLGGLETLQRMVASDPAVRAIVASGYSSAPVIAEHRQHGFLAALSKPYGVSDLAGTIRKVVGAALARSEG